MTRALVCGVLASAASFGVAEAGPLEWGEFAGSVSAGAEFTVGGDLSSPVLTTNVFAALDALPGALTNPLSGGGNPTSVILDLRATEYGDAHGEIAGIGLEGAWGIGSNREVIINAVYSFSSSATRGQIGEALVSNAAASARVPVFATFGDYKAGSVDVGLRQFFFPTASVKPYIAGRIGATFVNDIQVDLAIPGLGVNLPSQSFFDGSVVLSAGGDLGLCWDISERFSLMAETGIRYSAALEGNDEDLRPLGLALLNEDGDKFSVPVTVRARVKF